MLLAFLEPLAHNQSGADAQRRLEEAVPEPARRQLRHPEGQASALLRLHDYVMQPPQPTAIFVIFAMFAMWASAQ